MFTGIIQELGGVQRLVRNGDVMELDVLAPSVTPDFKIGDSIAVNGACLTVTRLRGNTFGVTLSPETLGSTNLKGLKPGDMVNLEPAMKATDRFGGHIVTGHVDAVGKVLKRNAGQRSLMLTIEAPQPVAIYLVPKGSVAVDGVSLTVVDPTAASFTVSVIPHTASNTTLGFKTIGSTVNLEADLVGKYIEKTVRRMSRLPGLTMETLRKHGFGG